MSRYTFRNIITRPELLEQIDNENIVLVNKFLKDKAVRTSPKTIVVYQSNLNMFFVWNLLYNNNKKFTDIKKLEFSEFFSFASEELKLGSARLNNIRSTLSSLSNFVVAKFYDDDFPNFRNVILNIIESSPKEARREKTILTDEQVENLLEHLKNTDKQKACWLALAVTSGARFTELLNFEVDLIDENRVAFGDLFLETVKQIKTKGRGKNGKMLYKYIIKDKFLPFYKEWVKERKNILQAKNLNHNFLFIKQDGTPATESIVRLWVAEFEKYLGISVYAHSFRHYLVTLLSKKNIPQPLIKELMGWSSAEMIQVYDDTSARDRIYDELKNIKL